MITFDLSILHVYKGFNLVYHKQPSHLHNSSQLGWVHRPGTRKLCTCLNWLAWPDRATNSLWVIRFQSNKRNGKQSTSKPVGFYFSTHFCSDVLWELVSTVQHNWKISFGFLSHVMTRRATEAVFRSWTLSVRPNDWNKPKDNVMHIYSSMWTQMTHWRWNGSMISTPTDTVCSSHLSTWLPRQVNWTSVRFSR